MDVKDHIRYGMCVVGISLGYIRKGDWSGLEQRIKNKISRKFEINVSENDIERILKGAADKLAKSEILIPRRDLAAEIYKKFDDKERADEIRKDKEEYLRIISKQSVAGSSYGDF